MAKKLKDKRTGVTVETKSPTVVLDPPEMTFDCKIHSHPNNSGEGGSEYIEKTIVLKNLTPTKINYLFTKPNNSPHEFELHPEKGMIPASGSQYVTGCSLLNNY